MKTKIQLESGNRVESFYDRQEKIWITSLKDCWGNQIGDSMKDARGNHEGVRVSQLMLIEESGKRCAERNIS